jgi:hypothetical protein
VSSCPRSSLPAMVVDWLGGLKGAQMRSCSSPVLVEETAEQITSVHRAWPTVADDPQTGGWIRRLQPKRPVWTVVLEWAA